MRPLLLHLHVPRASGSSLYGWLRLALPIGSVVKTNAASQVKTMVADRLDPGCPAVVSGHFAFGVHEILDGHPCRYLLLLREPVQRVLSLFRYIRTQPAHQLHGVLNQPDMTIARFYADRLPGSGPRNAMVAQLSGILGSRVTPQVDHLEAACEHLGSDRVRYGLAEGPGDLLEWAADFLQIQQAPAFPEINRSVLTEAWGGSEEDLAAIRAANQLDSKFYDHARTALLASCGKSTPWKAAPGRAADDHRRTS